jgi:hypothetical protein
MQQSNLFKVGSRNVSRMFLAHVGAWLVREFSLKTLRRTIVLQNEAMVLMKRQLSAMR